MTCALQWLWPARARWRSGGGSRDAPGALGPGPVSEGHALSGLSPPPPPCPCKNGSLPVPAGQVVTLSCRWPSAPVPWSCFQCGISSQWSLDVPRQCRVSGGEQTAPEWHRGVPPQPPVRHRAASRSVLLGAGTGRGPLNTQLTGPGSVQGTDECAGQGTFQVALGCSLAAGQGCGESTPSRWQSVAGGGA